MERVQDTFVQDLDRNLPLARLQVLEIGCGDGRVSEGVAEYADFVLGLDPSKRSIVKACARGISNAHFLVGTAQALPQYVAGGFDLVLYTLSLHHVPLEHLRGAICGAVAKLRPRGRIVFLEPGFAGSYFQAELRYGAGDGDERPEKIAARKVIESHPNLVFRGRWTDEVRFTLDSVPDFVESMKPRHGAYRQWASFVRGNKSILWAEREITVCEVRH